MFTMMVCFVLFSAPGPGLVPGPPTSFSAPGAASHSPRPTGPMSGPPASGPAMRGPPQAGQPPTSQVTFLSYLIEVLKWDIA